MGEPLTMKLAATVASPIVASRGGGGLDHRPRLAHFGSHPSTRRALTAPRLVSSEREVLVRAGSSVPVLEEEAPTKLAPGRVDTHGSVNASSIRLDQIASPVFVVGLLYSTSSPTGGLPSCPRE